MNSSGTARHPHGTVPLFYNLIAATDMHFGAQHYVALVDELSHGLALQCTVGPLRELRYWGTRGVLLCPSPLSEC